MAVAWPKAGALVALYACASHRRAVIALGLEAVQKVVADGAGRAAALTRARVFALATCLGDGRARPSAGVRTQGERGEEGEEGK